MRTSKIDSNYLSFSDDTVQLYLGTDHPESVSIPYPTVLKPSIPQEWDSLLKVSHNAVPLILCGMRIAQGRENALDCNRETSHVSIEGRFGEGVGVGDQVITIKGGSYDIALKGSIESVGRNAHCVIGQWSDQSTATTHHLDLSLLRTVSGEPITVIFGRVTNPLRTILFNQSPDISLPRNSKVKVWKSLGLLSYWWVKRFYVLLRYHRW